MTNFMSYGTAPAASAAGGQEDRVQETLNEFREEMRAGIPGAADQEKSDGVQLMPTYGQFALRVTSDAIDKVGIRHLVMAQKWAPPRTGMAALDIVAARPAAPVAPDWMGLIGIETTPVQGCMETRWTFEGASGKDCGERIEGPNELAGLLF